jgi:hypothetical protein
MVDEHDQSLGYLRELLTEMEQLAPARSDTAGAGIRLRAADDTPIDDSDPPIPDDPLDEADFLEGEASLSDVPIRDFLTDDAVPLAAVDCGIIRLGETENGLVIALRATISKQVDGKASIQLFQTGPIYLHNLRKKEILHRVGIHLGKPDLLVEFEDQDADPPVIKKVRNGVAQDAHKYGDRFRNWFERLAQRIAVTAITNGIVLFDGALTLRTIDTPQAYLRDLARLADKHGNAIIAVSKQSHLQVQGRSLRFWLDDVPERSCYRQLSSLIRRESGEERVLGNAYAARFSPLGPTFRMDVKAVEGQSDAEAINAMFTSCLMRGGYPDLLVQAHAHSYFTSPDVVQLQAQATAKYSLTPQPEVQLTAIFAPFGGRFK